MIAIDTSSFSRYFSGERGRDTQLVAAALSRGEAVLPGVVITELLSNRNLGGGARSIVRSLGIVRISDNDYWRRAATLRRNAYDDGINASISDVLIAQICIDQDIPLVTFDSDFRAFERAGLQLA